MSTTGSVQPLWDAAVEVLRENDLGEWTRPAPRLYPHQWSWDSAFIAIGLAHVDPERALREIESLLHGQWLDGRIPHIVYNPQVPADAYFPDAGRWDCPARSNQAPARPLTSGIIQPPVHALALEEVLRVAGERPAIRAALIPLAVKIVAWHDYLAAHRDPDARGLLTIYHPWESGTDNSPRWDAPLQQVTVGRVPPYVRRDLAHVADPSQRPTNDEYDRYLWLVESLKLCGYDDAEVHRAHPFLIKDALMSAVFARANHALAEVAEALELGQGLVTRLQSYRRRFSQGVVSLWDATDRLVLDWDLRENGPVRAKTWAGLALLLLPDLPMDRARLSAERLESRDFAGHPRLHVPVVPSTAIDAPGFRESTYWRGPAWPIANVLLWWGLRDHGFTDAAERLRRANLTLLSRQDAEFSEYFHPFTGAPLGSRRQSWTASSVLSWLADRG